MTDIFRKEYRQLDNATKFHMNEIKDQAYGLLEKFNEADSSESVDHRCMALARTNLEQAVMWAVKAIT